MDQPTFDPNDPHGGPGSAEGGGADRPTPQASRGLPPAAIAAIAVGVLLVIALIVGFAVTRSGEDTSASGAQSAVSASPQTSGSSGTASASVSTSAPILTGVPFDGQGQGAVQAEGQAEGAGAGLMPAPTVGQQEQAAPVNPEASAPQPNGAQQGQGQPIIPGPPPPETNPNYEWFIRGPYASSWTCQQAKDVWPAGKRDCQQGPDGNWYHWAIRQATH
ncbi:hypothetical protein [Corynebacterium heidelbergense]|uniref:Uncharacterized protein n=1 Tax=Corynebacterium heidelbergense TaxID=2055947 RepID=A0A364V7W1_9CORY|nr:hypothetical protein [Corynebacterium heidelbergense]RAV32735.1 hypothetical protein CWC39_10240 [Corynebacterium heidelbergense]WCZ36292.1 hypothetical protein CHEID_03685 [Corynebacterium heidelbergense]